VRPPPGARFCARKVPTITRKATEEIDVAHIHYQMQSALYDTLFAAYGSNKVSCEEATSSGRPADIIVSLPDGLAPGGTICSF
jgi:hypothetical protein